MTGELISIFTIVIAYLIGSIPFTFIIGKMFFKLDIRKLGSGNVGGANAIRIFGKKYGIIGGFLDIMKGTVAVIISKMVMLSQNIDSTILPEDRVIALSGFFAVAGHCFSIYLKFSGGKGGATTAGVILAIDLPTLFILLIFWIIIVGTTRFTSLGNLLAIITVPLMLDYRINDNSYQFMGYALTALIYFKHRANISRLIIGEERKFGEKEAIQ